MAYPRPSREGSRVVVHVIVALQMADSKHTRLSVESESPIPNGLTTVAKQISKEVEGERERWTYAGQRLDF
jgi:hypothetical protein